MMSPFQSMQWEHGGLFAVIVCGGLWLGGRIKELRVRLNGYTIEKKAK